MDLKHGRCFLSACALLLIGGCQTDGPARPIDRGDTQRLAQEENRLLSPFQSPRAIVADRLEIEISPNFYAKIAQPALSPGMHKSEVVREGGVDVYRFKNEQGGDQVPLDFAIGKTNLIAVQSAVLRVRGDRSDVQLHVVASGNVYERSGDQPSSWREVVYTDGSIQRR